MKKFLLFILLSAFLIIPNPLFSQDKGKATADLKQNPIEITIAGNRLKVENAPVGKKIEIISVMGAKAQEIEIKSSNDEYVLTVPKGFYIIKIGETVQKAVIR